MNAPLSRFLTRFEDTAAPLALTFEPITLEPMLSLSVGELESRLDAAREGAMREMEAAYATQLLELQQGQDAAIAEAVAQARAAWVSAESAAHVETLAAAFADLENALSQRIAAALRPLVASAIVARTCEVVQEAIGLVLADPDHPVVTVRGPSDLVASIRAACDVTGGMADRIAYVEADTLEITLDAAGSRVETRLAAALATLEEF